MKIITTFILTSVLLHVSCGTSSNVESRGNGGNNSSKIDNKSTSPFSIKDNRNGAVKPKSLVAKPKGQKSIN